MQLDDSEHPPAPSPAGERTEGHAQPGALLQQAMGLFRGQASFAFLGDIYHLAVSRLGFEGSLEQAAELLEKLPDVRVQIEAELNQSRVYASSYWSPTDHR